MNKQEIEKEIESTKSFIEFRREDIKKHEGEFHKINAIITKECKKINDLREKLRAMETPKFAKGELLRYGNGSINYFKNMTISGRYFDCIGHYHETAERIKPLWIAVPDEQMEAPNIRGKIVVRLKDGVLCFDSIDNLHWGLPPENGGRIVVYMILEEQ